MAETQDFSPSDFRLLFVHPLGYERGEWKRFDILVDGLRRRNVRVSFLKRQLKWGSLLDSMLGHVSREGDTLALTPPRWLLAVEAFLYHLIGVRDFAFSISAIRILRLLRPTHILISNAYWCALFLVFLRNLMSPSTAIVFDMPDLLARLTGKTGIRSRFNIVVNESFVPKSVDGVIVLTTFAKAYLEALGVETIRLHSLGELSSPPVAESIKGVPNRGLPLRIVWVGYLRPYAVRGIECVLTELKLLKRRFPERAKDVVLYVVGPFANTEDELRLNRVAKQENLPVIFTGYLPPEKLMEFLSGMDLGLQPLPPHTEFRFLPGAKVADYVAAGLGVIISESGARTEFLDGNYLTYDMNKPGSLANLLGTLTKLEVEGLSKRSKELVDKEFSESAVDRKLDGLLEFLEGALPRGPG